MLNEAYLIVLPGKHCIEKYSGEIARSKYLEEIRNAFSFLELTNYRGISRYPLSSEGFELNHELADDTLYFDKSVAQKVIEKINGVYELIKISKLAKNGITDFLGFDIGYFGGDCFSAICDSVIMPRWHPVDVQNMKCFSSHIKKLNKNLLFETYKDAKLFYDFYIEQSWSEKPLYPEQIGIIKVCQVQI